MMSQEFALIRIEASAYILNHPMETMPLAREHESSGYPFKVVTVGYEHIHIAGVEELHITGPLKAL